MKNNNNLTETQELRLRKVLISKIRRLREAPGMDRPQDDEDVDMNPDDATDASIPAIPQRDPAPQAPSEPVDAAPQANVGFTDGENPFSEPSTDAAPEAPAEPDDVEAPDMNPEPKATDDEQSSLRAAKVKMFFDKLETSPALMNLLTFNSPLEQVEAIQAFAELVKVPRGQLLPLLKGIRSISQEPSTEPTMESLTPKDLARVLREYVAKKNLLERKIKDIHKAARVATQAQKILKRNHLN